MGHGQNSAIDKIGKALEDYCKSIPFVYIVASLNLDIDDYLIFKYLFYKATTEEQIAIRTKLFREGTINAEEFVAKKIGLTWSQGYHLFEIAKTKEECQEVYNKMKEGKALWTP